MKSLSKLLVSGMFGLSLTTGCFSGTDEKGLEDVYEISSSTSITNTDDKAVEFVLDTSGSMDEEIDGVRKIDSAKESLNTILDSYEGYSQDHPNFQAGLLYFHLGSVQTVIPIGRFNRQSFNEAMKDWSADGGTPLGAALAVAERNLDKTGYFNKYVVLLTDGENTEGRAPEDIYKKIIETNDREDDSQTNVYIVAFNMDESYFRELKELGATVYGAKDGKQLTDVLQENTDMILEAYPDKK